MTRNSLCNSGSGASAYNGGPSARLIDGERLSGREYAAYPELA